LLVSAISLHPNEFTLWEEPLWSNIFQWHGNRITVAPAQRLLARPRGDSALLAACGLSLSGAVLADLASSPVRTEGLQNRMMARKITIANTFLPLSKGRK
jgi:hypothetical protein